MQHAGDAIVMHVRVFARGLFRHVDARRALADKPVAARRLWRRGSVVFEVERLVAEQVAIGNLTKTPLALDEDNAIANVETARLNAKPNPRARQQFLTRLRGGGAQGGRALVDR